jgi:hypothetical protein
MAPHDSSRKLSTVLMRGLRASATSRHNSSLAMMAAMIGSAVEEEPWAHRPGWVDQAYMCCEEPCNDYAKAAVPTGMTRSECQCMSRNSISPTCLAHAKAHFWLISNAWAWRH